MTGSMRSKVTRAMLTASTWPTGSAVQVTNTLMWSRSSRRRLMASPGDEPAGKGAAPGRCKMRRSKLWRISVLVISIRLFSPAQHQFTTERANEMPMRAAATIHTVARASEAVRLTPIAARFASSSNNCLTNTPGSNGERYIEMMPIELMTYTHGRNQMSCSTYHQARGTVGDKFFTPVPPQCLHLATVRSAIAGCGPSLRAGRFRARGLLPELRFVARVAMC